MSKLIRVDTNFLCHPKKPHFWGEGKTKRQKIFVPSSSTLFNQTRDFAFHPSKTSQPNRAQSWWKTMKGQLLNSQLTFWATVYVYGLLASSSSKAQEMEETKVEVPRVKLGSQGLEVGTFFYSLQSTMIQYWFTTLPFFCCVLPCKSNKRKQLCLCHMH